LSYLFAFFASQHGPLEEFVLTKYQDKDQEYHQKILSEVEGLKVLAVKSMQGLEFEAGLGAL
jgi:hypothetical protein